MRSESALVWEGISLIIYGTGHKDATRYPGSKGSADLAQQGYWWWAESTEEEDERMHPVTSDPTRFDVGKPQP